MILWKLLHSFSFFFSQHFIIKVETTKVNLVTIPFIQRNTYTTLLEINKVKILTGLDSLE